MMDPQSGTNAPNGASTVAPAGPRIEPMLIAAPSIPRPAARVVGVVASVIAAMLAGWRPGDSNPNQIRTKTRVKNMVSPVIIPATAASRANRKAIFAKPIAISEKTMTRLRPKRSAQRPHCGIMSA